MKRSRDEIVTEHTRNVRAKIEAKQNIKRLEEELDAHPDTILSKLPVSLHFLVTNGRIVTFDTNHTIQNYGYAHIETWLCKFTLDGKIYIGLVGRVIRKHETPSWAGISSLNERNKLWFEMLNHGAESETPLGIQELRNTFLSGNLIPDMWKWALDSQYGNEVRAIILLSHLYYCQTDEKVEIKQPKNKVQFPAITITGIDIITLPTGGTDE